MDWRMLTCAAITLLAGTSLGAVTGLVRQGGGSVPGGAVMCGGILINNQITLCCKDLIFLRAGLHPQCCGSIAFDGEHSMCCQNVVRQKVGQQPRCCGTNAFDASTGLCVGGQIRWRSSLGSVCCTVTEGPTPKRSNYYLGDVQGDIICCRSSERCCGRHQGQVNLSGFRPVCCNVAVVALRAECCSRLVTSTGMLPVCCTQPQVMPVCCHTGTRLTCCSPNNGQPTCCIPTEMGGHRLQPRPTAVSPLSMTSITPTVHSVTTPLPCCLPGDYIGSCINSAECRLQGGASCCDIQFPIARQRCCAMAGFYTGCCTPSTQETGSFSPTPTWGLPSAATGRHVVTTQSTPKTTLQSMPEALTTTATTTRAATPVTTPSPAETTNTTPTTAMRRTSFPPVDVTASPTQTSRSPKATTTTAAPRTSFPSIHVTASPTQTSHSPSVGDLSEPIDTSVLQLSCCIAPDLEGCCRAASFITSLVPHCCESGQGGN